QKTARLPASLILFLTMVSCPWCCEKWNRIHQQLKLDCRQETVLFKSVVNRFTVQSRSRSMCATTRKNQSRSRSSAMANGWISPQRHAVFRQTVERDLASSLTRRSRCNEQESSQLAVMLSIATWKFLDLLERQSDKFSLASVLRETLCLVQSESTTPHRTRLRNWDSLAFSRCLVS